MVAWANAIAEGRRDLSVVVNTEDFFSRTTCAVASNGLETGVGWSCIFAPMPHLCAFDTLEVRILTLDLCRSTSSLERKRSSLFWMW